ncbi:MAG: hypothetical protein HN509_16280 [Halobacteriovoraceae bacterium]|nr:hypothetical protein [Halobacteriovoraceae bacterium]MBT5094551.1 hypothetical protein [Halobacteriovoraceae bacterium]
MKNLLSIIAVLALVSTAFGHEGKHPRRPGQRKAAVVVVKGKRAQAIYTALETEEVTRNRPNFSVEVKRVAGLRCFKATKKADTAVTKYRCALRGKKLGRGGRGGRGHRRGNQNQN